MSVDLNAQDQNGAAPGRVARLRTRAQQTADRYQELAQRRPLLGLPLTFAALYPARQGLMMASAVAFRLFLWLMPLALLGAGILAGVSNNSGSNLESARKVTGITGAASQQIVIALEQGHKSWWIAVSVGGCGFLWGSRTLMRSLVIANAHAWEATARKTPQKALLLTTLAFAGMFITLILVMTAAAWLDRHMPLGVIIAGVLETTAAGTFWFAVSTRLPDRRTSWTDLLPGCVIVGVGLAALHVLSRVYLPKRFESSSKLYGALGAAGVALGWLLIFGQLIVGAALANSLWHDYRTGRVQASSRA